jgi:hypothetical protein
MWEMLIIRSSGNLKNKAFRCKINEYNGTALWVASYNFSKNKRPVVNRISAQFYFQDGLIIRHTDDFDIWKWSKQALGLTGYLFGWTGFMQNKIHTNAILSLRKYQKQFMIVQTLKTIFKRDLNRLKQEIELYPNESQIWKIQKE